MSATSSGTGGIVTPRQWTSRPPAEKQKELARNVSETDAKGKPITRDEWDKFDRLLWRYADAYPWYGAAYAGTRRLLSRALPTAAMGWKQGEAVLVCNPDFLFKLPFAGQAAILHHEMEHLIRCHLQTMCDWPEKQDILNFCMDALINTALEQSSAFPADVWDKIHLVMCDMNPQSQPGHVGPITLKHFREAVGDQPTDKKLRGEKWPDPTPADFVQNYLAEELLRYMPKGNDDDDIGGIATIRELMRSMHGGLGEFFDDSSVPDEMKESILDGIIDEAEKSAGTAPGHLQRHVDALKDKSNRNWRMLLRGVGNSSRIDFQRSWFKVNKKKPWLAPGKNIFTLPRVIIMIDTSGSIGQNEMNAFIREANNLCTQVEMDIAFIDSTWEPDAHPEQYIRNVKEGKAWKHAPYGGGGTQFKEFYDFMLTKGRKRYESCVILTDGFTCDTPLLPASPLARYNFALMTPNHNKDWVKAAQEAGFKVAVVDDAWREKKDKLHKETET